MFTMNRIFGFFTIVAVAVAALVASGCEDQVNPFIDEDRFYSVFGFLDTATDTQYVRVVALRKEFADSGAAGIDARVFTTERETGRTTEWRDSVITFSDGSVGHVFLGDFRPVPGWTYDLVVERSDGIRATAHTTVPVRSDVDIEDPILSGPQIAFQRVTWSDIDAPPFRVELWYRVAGTSPIEPFRDAVVVYPDEGTRLGEPLDDDAWQVVVSLSADREKVNEILGASSDSSPQLFGVGMRLTMSDDQWRPPDGVFDEEVLVQPGTFSNVDGGFGFFGSVNQYTVEWVLSPEVTERTGFSVPGKR